MKNNILIVSICVFAGVLCGGSVFLAFSPKKNTNPSTTPTLHRSIESPKNRLTMSTNQQVVTVGTTFTVSIVADTQNQFVSGYDAVVGYDPKIATYVSTTNVDPNFSVYEKASDTSVAVTGVKKSPSTHAQFRGEPIVTLTFRARAVGNTGIVISYVPGSTLQSNIYNEKTINILQMVENKRIFVGTATTLRIGNSIAIDPTIRVELTQIEKRAAACIDCQDRAVIVVYKGTEKKEISFTYGGIAGLMGGKQEAFGYMFDIDEFTNDYIVMASAKNK